MRTFFFDASLARYFLLAVIIAKTGTIYDKIRQQVAIHKIYVKMLRDQQSLMGGVLEDQEFMQDLITKRLFEDNEPDDVEGNLEPKTPLASYFKNL